METLNQLMQLAGALSTCSLFLVALGDLVTSLIGTFVAKVIAPKDAPWAQSVVFYWNLADDFYEDLRTFLDRISLYSRPRTTGS